MTTCLALGTQPTTFGIRGFACLCPTHFSAHPSINLPPHIASFHHVGIMTSSNIFDIKDWRDREIPFSDGSVWRISGKVSEHVIKRTAQDVVELGKTPSMHVAFTCYDSQTPGRHGILKIDLQYPITDTELRPLRVRRQQASSDIDRSSMEELEVLRRLTDAHCPSAPRLLAHDRRVQDDDDAIVPGGWALYRVITAPRGICLGSGIRSTLHGRDVVEGEFWRLPRGARDQIRSQLESAYE